MCNCRDSICKESSHENINIPNNNLNETTILDFGQNIGLFEPVEKWIEFRNNTPIPTRICVDTGRLSTKTNYADYENFPHKPKLGAVKYLFVTSRQSTENYLSSQNVLHDMDDHKTQIRILYGMFNVNQYALLQSPQILTLIIIMRPLFTSSKIDLLEF